MANNVSPLDEAALSGDIDRLYALIEANPDILNDLDEERLSIVKTPLHIATSVDLKTNPIPGQELTYLYFATEIMVLKPSFALKLNPQGLSPLHLAIQNGHSKLARRFVDMNKDLVRVNGREGTTPLHLVSQIGDCDLLAYFLSACPDSIEDVNTRDETALHLAVRYQQFDALSVLVGWLKENTRMSAASLESSILNRRDVAGNTILHLSVINQDIQTLDLLIRNQVIIHVNVKNSENNTALEEAGSSVCSEDMKSKLYMAGARPGSSLQDNPTGTLVYQLISRSRARVGYRFVTKMKRMKGNLSDSNRDAYLVAATLILTTIYQSALSPPGGLYQADANNATSPLNPAAGKSVLSTQNFVSLSIINSLSLLSAIIPFLFLIPSGRIGTMLIAPTFYFVISYLYSVELIAPPHDEAIVMYPDTRHLMLLYFIFTSGIILSTVWNSSFTRIIEIYGFRALLKMCTRGWRSNNASNV